MRERHHHPHIRGGRWGGGEFGGGGGGRHWRGRGRGRVFEQGELRLVILKLIADQPRHGYEIIKAIEDALGGAYSPSPGVVYPTLTYLEDMGFAALTSEEGGKKLFGATDQGRKLLEANANAVTEAFARAETVGGGRKSALRIRRAMDNLSTALKLRAQAGPLDDDVIDKITAAIDAAAHAVERT